MDLDTATLVESATALHSGKALVEIQRDEVSVRADTLLTTKNSTAPLSIFQSL